MEEGGRHRWTKRGKEVRRKGGEEERREGTRAKPGNQLVTNNYGNTLLTTMNVVEKQNAGITSGRLLAIPTVNSCVRPQQDMISTV